MIRLGDFFNSSYSSLALIHCAYYGYIFLTLNFFYFFFNFTLYYQDLQLRQSTTLKIIPFNISSKGCSPLVPRPVGWMSHAILANAKIVFHYKQKLVPFVHCCVIFKVYPQVKSYIFAVLSTKDF